MEGVDTLHAAAHEVGQGKENTDMASSDLVTRTRGAFSCGRATGRDFRHLWGAVLWWAPWLLGAALWLLFPARASAQTILVEEPFEDDQFGSRGWYDTTGGTISTSEHIPGSTASFECVYPQGGTHCEGGTPGRHLFDETETVYVSYWVKYSANWEGSNHPYHPHEFMIMTNADGQWVGPAFTHLTAYVEQNEGTPMLALQDGQNVDMNCILRNDDSFIGCNGDFDSYHFTEDRSVCACNGIVGDLDERDCFPYGDGYYSARSWKADDVYFRDEQGSYYKNDWHHVEAYFEMNSIQNGVGVPDGKIRYWYDGQLLISYDHILFRTASHADLKFNQFFIGPYIGDGSPVTQTMWVDELTIATAPPQCADGDSDGHQDAACGGDDCDDTNADIHPGATEQCGDGIDQDCDGQDLPCEDCVDADSDGHQDAACGGDDCDDSNADIHPGATEVCGDGIDQDCNGTDLSCDCADADSDGHQDAACGGDDCDDTNADIHPGATEVCSDGVDNDCNGLTDDQDTDACGTEPNPNDGGSDDDGCGCRMGSDSTDGILGGLLVVGLVFGLLYLGIRRRRRDGTGR